MEKDPVCGMSVDPAKAAGKKVHKGKNYYFCSIDCMKKFEQSPQRYEDRPVSRDMGNDPSP